MPNRLTQVESRIVSLVNQGLDNKEVAEQAKATVSYVKNVLYRVSLRLHLVDGWGCTRVRIIRATYVPPELVADTVQLTDRQAGLVKLVYAGHTNKEIAQLAGLTEQDVKNRLKDVYDKTGCWTRAELALYVANRGGDQWRPYIAQSA